jgi:hypothetical protein
MKCNSEHRENKLLRALARKICKHTVLVFISLFIVCIASSGQKFVYEIDIQFGSIGNMLHEEFMICMYSVTRASQSNLRVKMPLREFRPQVGGESYSLENKEDRIYGNIVGWLQIAKLCSTYEYSTILVSFIIGS